MGAPIRSKAVYTGRNYDVGAFRDDRYIRCSRCGWINNLDRDIHSVDGGYEGWGTTFTTVTSTSGGSGYGPNSPADTMQTPSAQGQMIYSTDLCPTDTLVNSYGTFSWDFGNIPLLNGSTTSIVSSAYMYDANGNIMYDANGNPMYDESTGSSGTFYAVMLLLFNSQIYAITNTSQWYQYTGNWSTITGDPRMMFGNGQMYDSSQLYDSVQPYDCIEPYIETTMDAVVGAGCSQCGTLLYNR